MLVSPRKLAIIGCLCLIVAVALVATATLGNPLGRAIGVENLPRTAKAGAVDVAAADAASLSAADLADLAAYADRWSAALARWTGSPQQPVTLKVFASRSDYDEACTARVPGFVSGMDWCYDPSTSTVWCYAMEPKEMRARLRHELFHHQLRELPGTPLWMEEGTAELLEGADLAADGSIQLQELQRDHLLRAARRLGSNPLKILQSMASLTSDQFRQDRLMWYSMGYCASTWMLTDQRLSPAVRGGDQVARASIADPAARDPFVAFARTPGQWKTAVGQRVDAPVPAATPAP